MQGPTLVSVGALIPRKGHALTIEALTRLPGWSLLIAGEGPERVRLQALAAQLDVADRVRLLGSLPHAELAGLYSAADLSVLSSAREGWANVLLESMACGTAVVASPIAGNPEVVAAPEAGGDRACPHSRGDRHGGADLADGARLQGGDARLCRTFRLGGDERGAARHLRQGRKPAGARCHL